MDAQIIHLLLTGASFVGVIVLGAHSWRMSERLDDEAKERYRVDKNIDELCRQRFNNVLGNLADVELKLNLLLAELEYEVAPNTPTLRRTAEWNKRQLDKEHLEWSVESARIRSELAMAELAAKNRRAGSKQR